MRRWPLTPAVPRLEHNKMREPRLRTAMRARPGTSTVWNLHTDVDAWPAWNLEMTAAKLDGAFAPGSSFTWTSYDFTVTSTIYTVENHSRTLWGGAAQGIMGTHEWRFAQSPAGVHVITTESFAGDPVDANPTGMQTILDNSLTAWLTRLKQKAESSARGT